MKYQILILISAFSLIACSATDFKDQSLASGTATDPSPAKEAGAAPAGVSQNDTACFNQQAQISSTADMLSPESPLDLTFSDASLRHLPNGALGFHFTLKNELSQASTFRLQLGCMLPGQASLFANQMIDPVTGVSPFEAGLETFASQESRTYDLKFFGSFGTVTNYDPCWMEASTRHYTDGAKCMGTVQ